MTSPRRAARKDSNHKGIADALRRVGFYVRTLNGSDSKDSEGLPDLLVWRTGGPFLLIECKGEHGQLTPAQVGFFAETEGCPCAIVRSPLEAVSVAQRLHLAWAQRP